MHSVFLNVDGGWVSDVTVRDGVGPVTRPYVGFGVAFLDYDNDTDLDLAIANGHVMANVASLRGGGTFAQRNLLLRNSGGRFQNVTNQAGPGFSIALVSRALAAGDVDNDGDLDLLVTNNGAAVNLLLNEGGPRGPDAETGGTGNGMLVRVIGTKSNRSGIGARLALTTGGRRQLRRCSRVRAICRRTTCVHTSASVPRPAPSVWRYAGRAEPPKSFRICPPIM